MYLYWLASCGILLTDVVIVFAYYKRFTVYGTGDTIVTIYAGSHVDDQHRWSTECMDGEAMIGLHDGGEFTAFGVAWCKFMFPKKKPNFGIYPYYDYCNVRDVTAMKEYYCYDKYYPVETYDTFVTAYTTAQSYAYVFDGPSGFTSTSGANPEMYKCCKLPYGYHLDYSRCQYHYSHDKFGEHYDENNMFNTKCDRDFLLTGMGKAPNPWDGALHYVWVQCCPLFYNEAYVPLYVTANLTLHLRAGVRPSRPMITLKQRQLETDELKSADA